MRRSPGSDVREECCVKRSGLEPWWKILGWGWGGENLPRGGCGEMVELTANGGSRVRNRKGT